MRDPFALADVLADFIQRSGYTPSQLARLTHVPQATIVNWLEGRVKRPRHWDSLLQVAAALHLTEAETNRLLQAGDHPSVEELLQRNDPTALPLLQPWQERIAQQTQAPFQAIADLPYFVGREAELRAIRQALLHEQPALCSLQGMAGVGKTALAVHAAYQLRSQFPDGVLWANLDKTDPLAILGAIAGAYDQDVSRYTDVESRSQVVRNLLAHKRALLLLDNVPSSAAIHPLLPPTGSCAVLLTSRRTDLWFAHGVHQITLHEFDRDDDTALALCRRLLGTAYVQRHADAMLTLLDLLGRLPLAVTLAASRLAYEPNWCINDFLARLQQPHGRLDELCYGDQDLRSAFDATYHLLTPVQQHFFAALGALPDKDFTVEATAAVTGTKDQPLTREILYKLATLSLVQPGPDHHYRLHPLLRDYALSRLPDPATARARLVEFLRHPKEKRRTEIILYHRTPAPQAPRPSVWPPVAEGQYVHQVRR